MLGKQAICHLRQNIVIMSHGQHGNKEMAGPRTGAVHPTETARSRGALLLPAGMLSTGGVTFLSLSIVSTQRLYKQTLYGI